MLVVCPRSSEFALPPILLPTPTSLLKDTTNLGEEGAFPWRLIHPLINLFQNTTITAPLPHKKHLGARPCPGKLTYQIN